MNQPHSNLCGQRFLIYIAALILKWTKVSLCEESVTTTGSAVGRKEEEKENNLYRFTF
jgi:hypothetical protein